MRSESSTNLDLVTPSFAIQAFLPKGDLRIDTTISLHALEESHCFCDRMQT